MATLAAMAQPFAALESEQLWRGELGIELAQLTELQHQIQSVETKLDELAAADARVQLLRTIPGVGPRLAEAIVTMFDDVRRFTTAGQVGAYVGMVPKQFDSGEMQRSGRITRHGNRLVRSLLVEIAWASLRHNPWARQTFQRISGGKKSRRKIAIVAVGRKLLVRCWGMLRHETAWRVSEPRRGGANSNNHRRTNHDAKHAPAARVQRFVMSPQIVTLYFVLRLDETNKRGQHIRVYCCDQAAGRAPHVSDKSRAGLSFFSKTKV